MNLFRSEEHVRSWPHFDSSAEDGILSLDGLVHMFSMDFCRRRLDENYVSASGQYTKELFDAASKLGEEKAFWAIE